MNSTVRAARRHGSCEILVTSPRGKDHQWSLPDDESDDPGSGGPGRLSHGDRDDEIGCWWQASQVVLIVAAALAGWFPGHSAAVTARSGSGTRIIECSANSGSAETRRGGTHRVV